jgi:TolA-binding protein
MGRIFFLLLSVVFISAKGVDASFEESLELRKIAEYWKEKDYKTVKLQIRDFLSKNPKSSYVDQLYAMLGDLYFQEKNFTDAAVSYEKILSKEFRQKTLFHRLHCLYEMGRYDDFVLDSSLFLNDPNAKAEDINAIRFELGEIYFCKAHAPENEGKKKELMKAALAEYQRLGQTKYSEMTILPQAQIYAYLEDRQRAAALFLALSHKDASKKEEYLFHAACMQIHFDKSLAIETFGSIYALGGKTASKAAFNQLNLLFQEKRYRDFALASDKAMKYITADKVPLIQYFLGKSLYFTHDWAKAIDPLSQSLGSKALDKTQEKSALISLVACAKEIQDLTLFEKALSTLKAEFANDEDTANVLLMHVQLYRDKKQWAKARAEIREILEISPKHPQREALLYDNGLLLLQEEKWLEGATAFEAFLKEFPQSPQRANGFRQIIHCRLEDARKGSNQKIKKEQLLSSLNAALQEKKAFSPQERQKMRYLVGKVQFELASYDEAIGTLSEYVKDFSKDPTCAEAYLLLAYAHEKEGGDQVHFALNAEKALGLNPNMQGAPDLRLTLFNTYLGLAEHAHDEEKKEMVAKAASHLFLALDKPPSEQNQRWLAGYYFQQYKAGQGEAGERAAIVLEKLLGIKENSLSITEQTLEREAEALKLGELFRKTGRLKEHVQLLEALNKQYQSHPELRWKYQRMAQFELGKAYLSVGDKEKARNSFEELIRSSSHVSSYFALAATLEKAKLDYALLKDKNEGSAALQTIFNSLKDVQLKRKLHSEPLHLEAALCYVDFKGELIAAGKRNPRIAFLLKEMKENYSAENDPLVKNYFSAAAQFPEKEKLCHQYLAFVDIEIQRLNAEETHHVPLLHDAKEKLDDLLAQTQEETLKIRIVKSREALKRSL